MQFKSVMTAKVACYSLQVPTKCRLIIFRDCNRSSISRDDGDNNNNSAQRNLGRGPRRCESLSRGGLITTAKVIAGEIFTPQHLLPTLWAKPAQIQGQAQGQAQSSSKNRRRCKWWSVSFRRTIFTFLLIPHKPQL